MPDDAFCNRKQFIEMVECHTLGKVLIITSRNDAHVDHVIERFNSTDRGHLPIRLNTEDFIENCVIQISEHTCCIDLKDSRRTITADAISSVWYRRPVAPNFQTSGDDGIDEFRCDQAESALEGLYFILHRSASWINSIPALELSKNKIQQLQLARALGFRVPRTLVTNSPDHARSFVDANDKTCIKSLSRPHFYINGELRPFLTRQISKDAVSANAENIRLTPIILQEYIDKRADVRITAFGDHMIGVLIESQGNPLSIDDMRGAAPHKLTHRVIEVPEGVKNFVRRFMKEQGLIFSTMDFALSTSGEYVFLENNPNGQWLWLEQETGHDFTSALIATLTSGKNEE